MIKPTTIQELNNALETKGKIVLKFGAKWCSPCKTLDPILDELDATTDILVVNIDVDTLPQAADYHNVMSIPTTFLFNDGITKDRFVGIRDVNYIKNSIGE